MPNIWIWSFVRERDWNGERNVPLATGKSQQSLQAAALRMCLAQSRADEHSSADEPFRLGTADVSARPCAMESAVS